MNNQHNQNIQLDKEMSSNDLRVWKMEMSKKLNPSLHERLSQAKPALTKAELNLKMLRADIKRTERLVKKSEKAHVKLAPEFLKSSASALRL